MSSLSVTNKRKQHIVVVLGMHRSGTSSLTRGLRVLGIDLGANLFDGIEGNNDKGFFEDVDVNGFNVELLSVLGRDWHSLEPILPEELSSPVVQEFKLRAIDLLRNKVKDSQCFGLKDPRITRLLPFWVSVFDHLKIRVSYVIAFRHPMSVARSLQKRDGFDLEKGYLLWVDHMLASLRDTDGRERVVVEYDRLMVTPEHEIRRIANAFNLNFDSAGKEFSEYKVEFLDSSLRHTEFQAEDLLLEYAAPFGMVELYQLLVELSEDRLGFDAHETRSTVEQLVQELRNSHTLLRFLNRKDTELATLASVASESEGRLSSQEQILAQQKTEIDALNQAVIQRDGHIASLNQAIAQYVDKVSSINETVVQYGDNVSSLNKELAARNHEIGLLNQTLAERDVLDTGLVDLQDSLKVSEVEIQRLLGVSRDNELLVQRLNSDIGNISSDRDGLLSEVEILKAELEDLRIYTEKKLEENERLHLQVLAEMQCAASSEVQVSNQEYMAKIVILESAIERNSFEYMKNLSISDELLKENTLLSADVLARTQHVAHLEDACAVFKQEISDLESKVYYAWQEVEALKNANAEARFLNERLVNSSSWRLTAPLRFFRLHLISKPYIFFRKKISQSLFALWRLLPVSTGFRLKLKAVLYRTFPFVFKSSESYQQWKFFSDAQKSNAVLLEQQQETSVPSTGLQRPVSEIPRIKFDSTQNQFVEHRDNPLIDPVVKLIAFYLPQFHPFPENDAWWGKGFTEWTNVTKAYPNYVDHYQPHYPIHTGYYDLRVAEVMEEQARLAKEYGVYGFSYYFYWFAGKILMDKPLEQMLANPKVDMPFCFTWANENWSRRWDGQENDILIAQHHSDNDSLEFIRHLFKYFRDDRYIKIDGKPLLIIYRASIIPDMEKTAVIWREELIKNGFPGLYLVCAQSFGIKSPAEFGFDASVEFPPHTVSSTDIRHELNMSNPDFNGHVFSYEQVVANAVASKEPDYKLFRAAMLSWDNTARKQNNSHTFHGFSLLRYKQWLSSITNNVFNNAKYGKDEKLVFVNAWNEWAEGTHLEPDRKFGYGYLQATYDVLAEYDMSKVSRLAYKRSVRQSDYAVILHLHYEELWGDIKKYLNSLSEIGFDLYVTVTSSSAGVKVIQDYPKAHVHLVENRGRDILPFLGTLEKIKDMGYAAVCKIHSKRSVYRQDGDKIRDELMDSLLGSNLVVSQIVERFSKQPDLGLIVSEKYLIPHTDHNMTFNTEIVAELSSRLNLDFSYGEFVAGSMFWFKPKALEAILSVDGSLFEVEDGLADGTLAHGVERVICNVVKNANYTVATV